MTRKGPTVPVDSRWQLTDIQRFLAIVTVVLALFLGAMSWGMGSVLMAVIAVAVVTGAGLGVFLLGLRANGRNILECDATIMGVSPPPVGSIVGRCELRLLVDLPGRPSTMVKLRDPAVPVVKWPQVGSVLPVEILPRAARPLRVRWDRVEARAARPVSPAEDATGLAVPFFTDYADDVRPRSVPPTPTRAMDERSAPESEADDFAELDALDALADAEALADIAELDRIETVDDIDAIVSGEPSGDERARAADYELPMRSIPQPRDEPDLRPSAALPGQMPSQARDADGQAMGVMLVVSDLARSVRFYRDQVGFEVVDSGANVAVLAYGEGRILLRQLADMSPVERRVSHLHIRVSDVDLSYKDLKARGVEFVHRPRVTSRGDKLDLWSATFRDPDGHDIALTQWRTREDAGPAT
jgi:catechol 2,3-dioxygenase-like lactoylglutathione lyase family enzyme